MTISMIREMLISTIRAGMCGVSIDENIKSYINEENLKKLYDLAQKHDVTHIVGEGLLRQKLMPDGEVSGLFKLSSMTAFMRYQLLTCELNSICDLFEKNQIDHMPLKGAVLRKLYPEPWFRTSCDVDILVRPDDLKRAVNLLETELMCSDIINSPHDVALYTKNKVHIELHHTLFGPNMYDGQNVSKKWNFDCQQHVWEMSSQTDGKKYRYEMPDEFVYCYHIAHMAKHFEVGGCGVRPFIDLWILNNITFDRQKRSTLLKECGLLKFENEVKKLSLVWMQNEIPDKTSLLIQDYIFDGGVFGNVNNMVLYKQAKSGGHTGYILSRLIASRNLLEHHYPILKKHRWLMPFCQVGRWLKIIFRNRLKISINELAINNKINDDIKNNMKDLIKILGL